MTPCPGPLQPTNVTPPHEGLHHRVLHDVLAIAYIAALGAFEVLKIELFDTERGGGRIGRFLAGTLQPLLTGPGTFVLLAAIAGLGLMLAFNLQLRELFAPLFGTARWLGSTTAGSMRRAGEARQQKPGPPATNGRAAKVAAAAAAKAPVAVPMATPDELAAARSILDEVLQEGNPNQKQEAQRLLDSIR